MTGVYLGPSVQDALGDNGKHDLAPRGCPGLPTSMVTTCLSFIIRNDLNRL
jgi:hypothetical protein